MSGKILEYKAKIIKREGMEEEIKGTISILKNLGVSTQTILIKIQEQYNLSSEASKKFL